MNPRTTRILLVDVPLTWRERLKRRLTHVRNGFLELWRCVWVHLPDTQRTIVKPGEPGYERAKQRMR